MAGNYDELMAKKAELEAEQARLAAIAAADGTNTSETLSEFDNNVDLIHSQSARLLDQATIPFEDLPADSLLRAQPADQFSEFDITMPGESEFGSGYFHFERPKDAADRVHAEVLAQGGTGTQARAYGIEALNLAKQNQQQEVIYPQTEDDFIAQNISKLYRQNPERYRNLHGDVAADEQEALWLKTNQGQFEKEREELFATAAIQTEEREAKENAAIEKYGLEDREGFQLYQRNPDRYEVIYGTEARDELDNLIGRERTISHAGGTVGEHGSAMALAKAADDKSNSETILTETDLAASQNDGTETDTSESVAKSIATELNLDVHDTTKITEDLETGSNIKNPKEKATWIKSIRSFYKENPELATAIIRAASTYLQTGKWYMAAAAGLEGALEGAGVKIAADQAQLTRQEGLRSKYTPESVNKYNISGNVEDLEWDMTKIDKNHDIYLKELAARTSEAKAEELRKLLVSLNHDNVKYLEARQDNIASSLASMFDKEEKGDGFKKSGFGVEKGDIGSLILLHARNNGLVDSAGNIYLEQITETGMNDIRNIVEEYGRIQYKHYDKNGYVDRNMSLLKFADQMIIRKELEQGPGISGALLEELTTDPKEGIYAAESTAQVQNTIQELIRVNTSWDVDPDTADIQKPTENQIWKQLGAHWTDMGKDNQEYWMTAAKAQKKPPTSGFLFFANQWVTAGDEYEWFKTRDMQLFQTPKISIPATK